MKISNWIVELNRGDGLAQRPEPMSLLRRNRENITAFVKDTESGEWLGYASALICAGRSAIIAASLVADKPTRHEWAWRELFKMARRLGLPMAAILTMATKCNQVSIWSDHMAEIKAARSILESYGKI